MSLCDGGSGTARDVCTAWSDCAWDYSDPSCNMTEGFNTPACCIDVTQEPTVIPSSLPTASPTCPDNSNSSDPCYALEQECCEAAAGICGWKQTSMCLNEGGLSCCYELTDAPTKAPSCPVK